VTLLSTAPAGSRPAPLFPLRLHLTGEARSAFGLLMYLDQRLHRVEVEGAGTSATLTRESVRLWGFRADEPLLPPEPLEHPGVRLLREWLVLPAKFAFVDIASSVDALGPRLTLRFRFDASLPVGLHVSRDSIRTNCVPVVNVYATTTEPLRPSLAQPTQVLRPAGASPESGDIYAIRHVTATLRGGGVARIPEATSFRPVDSTSPPGLTYTVRTESGPDRLPQHLLELEVAPDAPPSPEVHSLSIDAWATSRHLGRGLGIGDVSVPPLASQGFTFKNISAVTPYRPAPVGTAVRRATLAMLVLSTGSLASVGALRALLHALNLHVAADRQAARAHALRLQAIRLIELRPSTQPIARALARGHDLVVHLTERGFDGEGEAFAFGKVLAHLFAHEASLNAFARTTVRLVDTGRTFHFAPLNGDRVVS
jgi:type VI secretion system protein ImpG